MKKKRSLQIGKSVTMLSVLLLVFVVLFLASGVNTNIKGRSLTVAASSSMCADSGGLCVASCPNGYTEDPSLSTECSTDIPHCGDGNCDFNEDCSSCSDCGTCDFFCSDGTLFGECSGDGSEGSLYCNDGELIADCTVGCPACDEAAGYHCDTTTGACSGGIINVSLRCNDGICSPEIGEDCSSCAIDCLPSGPSGQICCIGEFITPVCSSDAQCASGQTCLRPGTCTSYCQGGGGGSPIMSKTEIGGGGGNPTGLVVSDGLKCCVLDSVSTQETTTESESLPGEKVTLESGEIQYVVDLVSAIKRSLDDVETIAKIEIITDTTGKTDSFFLTIKEKTDYSVTLDLEGLVFAINKGERKQIDLDNDGIVDLYITIDDIQEGVDFTFEKYVMTPVENSERVVAGIQQDNAMSFDNKNFKKTLLVVIIVLAGAILVMIIRDNMPKGPKKKNDELEGILNKAKNNLNKGKFHAALASYSSFHDINIPKEFQQEVDKVIDGLNLYVKVNQAQIFSKKKVILS